MGETGCGKTRLIKYMCDLAAQGATKHVQNMLIMKVTVNTIMVTSRNNMAMQYTHYWSHGTERGWRELCMVVTKAWNGMKFAQNIRVHKNIDSYYL